MVSNLIAMLLTSLFLVMGGGGLAIWSEIHGRKIKYIMGTVIYLVGFGILIFALKRGG